jgi:serine/threonine-protein kinase
MNNERFLRKLWLALGICTVQLVARPSQAEGDAVAAQALFDQAKQLMSEGKYGEACPKLEESQRLDPGSGTLLNLADCYEREGKLASAWTKFLEAASAAQTVGKADREATARERAAGLAKRLGKIVINVTGAETPGLAIKRDGNAVGNAQWGVPIPADRGTHSISAEATGRKGWEQKINVTDGTVTTVTVPQLEASAPTAPATAPPAATPAPPVEAPAAPSTSSSATSQEAGGLGGQRIIALTIGTVGVAGVVVGSIFGLKSKSKHDEAASHCTDGPGCYDDAGVKARSDARSAGNISTIAFMVGGVGLVGGATLWLTGKPHSPSAATARVRLGLDQVVLEGSW